MAFLFTKINTTITQIINSTTVNDNSGWLKTKLARKSGPVDSMSFRKSAAA